MKKRIISAILVFTMLTLTSCEVNTDMIVKLLKIVMTVNSDEKPDDSPERYDTTTALKRGDKKDT